MHHHENTSSPGIRTAFQSAGKAFIITFAGFGAAGLIALASLGSQSVQTQTTSLPECRAVPLGGLGAGGVSMPTDLSFKPGTTLTPKC